MGRDKVRMFWNYIRWQSVGVDGLIDDDDALIQRMRLLLINTKTGKLK